MRKNIKETARKALKGNMGKAAAITLLPAAVFLLIVLIQALLAIIFEYPLVMDILTECTSFDQIKQTPLSSWLTALGGILAAGVFLLPLNLGVKRWYYQLFPTEKKKQPTAASKSDIAALNIHFKDIGDLRDAADCETYCDENPTITFEPPYTAETNVTDSSPVLPIENSAEDAPPSPAFGEIFNFFAGAKNYFGSIWFQISLGIRCAVWFLLFSLPGAAILGVQLYLLGAFSKGFTLPEVLGNDYLLLIPAVALLVFSWIICGIFLLRYFAAPYFWTSSRENMDTKLTPSAAMKESVKVMNGRKLKLLGYVFTFAGWGLLLVFILPALYVIPYYQAFLAAFVSQATADEENNGFPAE